MSDFVRSATAQSVFTHLHTWAHNVHLWVTVKTHTVSVCIEEYSKTPLVWTGFFVKGRENICVWVDVAQDGGWSFDDQAVLHFPLSRLHGEHCMLQMSQ